jgi:MFS family permease
LLLVESRRPARIRESPHAHWYTVGTVCIGAFMGQLDASIVTLALPRLASHFRAGAGLVEWVALSYLLVLVASIVQVGQFSDRFGRKLLYVYGFAVFTVGSALCGLAPTVAVLIAARVLQALGAAMLQANSVALISEAVPRSSLPRAIGVQGAAQAIGLALGPAVGGALLALGGWRLIFLINLPAGAIGLIMGWFLLPRSRHKAVSAHVNDRFGAVLRSRALSIGLASGLVSYMVLFGTLAVVPYFLAATSVGAASAGIRLAILPVALAIAAPLAGRQAVRTGGRLLPAGGLLLASAGLSEIVVWPSTSGLLIGLAVTGLGIGAFTPVNNASIMAAAPRGRNGLVSGILNMTRGLGTALGVAVATALYDSAAGVHQRIHVHPSTAVAAHALDISAAGLGVTALVTGTALLLLQSRSAAATRHVPARDRVG